MDNRPENQGQNQEPEQTCDGRKTKSKNSFGFTPKHFHPYMLPNNFSCIIYGQRRSGKTTWVSWFLYWFQCRFRELYVFSSTAFNGHYQDFCPEHHVFPRFREDILEMIIENQKQIMGVECHQGQGTHCAGDGTFSKQAQNSNRKGSLTNGPFALFSTTFLTRSKTFVARSHSTRSSPWAATSIWPSWCARSTPRPCPRPSA